MTVSELIEQLKGLDPTTLITVNTAPLAGRPGIFPIETASAEEDIEIDGESYHCVVLEVMRWWP